jgi:hypothetical protein
MAGAARTAAMTAAMIAAPAPSPPTRATRALAWAASRLSTKSPSAVRSNGAPSAASARTAAGPSVVSRSTMPAGSHRPAPAAMVSAACRARGVLVRQGRGHAALGPGAGAAVASGVGDSTSALRGAAARAAVRPARPAPRITGPSKVMRRSMSASTRLPPWAGSSDQLHVDVVAGLDQVVAGRDGGGGRSIIRCTASLARARRWPGSTVTSYGRAAGRRRCSPG